MHLEVITPDAKLFEGEVSSVIAPAVDGYLGILNDHAPMISTLKKGEMTIVSNGKEQSIQINGGVLEVSNNVISVLAD
jgi:F-type H+-transporting ATPase subunit epsilon